MAKLISFGSNAFIVRLIDLWDVQAASEIDDFFPDESAFFGDEAHRVCNDINGRSRALRQAWTAAIRATNPEPLAAKVFRLTYYAYTTMEIAYLVVDKDVYFTGLHQEQASTINAAEIIVNAIAEEENINWKEYTFYDIQTLRSYSVVSFLGGECYYVVDQIVFVEGGGDKRLMVSDWKPVEALPRQPAFFRLYEGLGLPGIPPEVLEAFLEFIPIDREE